MRLKIIKNFLSPEEIIELNNWVIEGVHKRWLDDANTMSGTTNSRLTTRKYNNRFFFPPLVYSILKRIKTSIDLEDIETVPNQGRDGIIATYIKPGGDLFLHKDVRPNGMSVLQCNIITQTAEQGGQLIVDGKAIELNAGDLHCYLASEYEHRVTTVVGDKARIIWLFGFAIEKERWETI